jgi:hypothetical protein
MVITQNVECQICGAEYFLRVGIGYDSYQKHHFDCLECEQPLVIATRANPPNAHIESVENVALKYPDDNKTVINLHPNCAFSPEIYHERREFPSISHLNLVSSFVRMRPGKFQDLCMQWDMPNAGKRWAQVKALLRLPNNPSKVRIRRKLISRYSEKRKECNPLISHEKTNDVVCEFFDSLFYPKINDLVSPVKNLIDNNFENDNFNLFAKHYERHLKVENLNRYISTLSSFFRYRDQLGQLIDYARISSDDVDNKVVGSKNFDEVKLYYGEVYEALTSNFTILACLNNLIKGRKFDQFESMSLNKYIKDVDKSKRGNPFKDVDALASFSEDLDSSLRNGSHHASIWRNGEIVMFRSGGSGAQREMSFSRYLHICNKLTISLSALFLVERHIQSKYS